MTLFENWMVFVWFSIMKMSMGGGGGGGGGDVHAATRRSCRDPQCSCMRDMHRAMRAAALPHPPTCRFFTPAFITLSASWFGAVFTCGGLTFSESFWPEWWSVAHARLCAHRVATSLPSDLLPPTGGFLSGLSALSLYIWRAFFQPRQAFSHRAVTIPHMWCRVRGMQ